MGEARLEDSLDRARHAFERHEWAEAHELLTQADGDGGLEPEDLAKLGVAAYLSAHPDVAVEAWERAHGAWLKAGNRAGAAEAAIRVCELLLDSAQLSAFQAWARRAEQLLEGLPESSSHGRLAVARGFAALIVGDLGSSLAWGHLAEEIGTRVEDAASRALGRNLQGRALILQGYVPEGLALLDETFVAAASRELDPFSAAIVYCSAVCGTQALADYERAEAWLEAMERFCRRQAVGSFHGWCRVHGAEIKRFRGQWLDAEAEARRAYEEVRAYGRVERGWPLYEIGMVRLRMGDLAGAEDAFLEGHGLGWDIQPGLALLRLAQGNVGEAAASIRDALDNPSDVLSFERPPNTDLRMAPLFEAQVEIAEAAVDLDRARWAAGELERVAKSLGNKAFRATAAVARGRVQVLEGDVAAGRQILQQGVRLWTELGAPYETARARMVLAGAFRAEGNPERALLELNAARSTLERLGARIDARRAREAEAEIRPAATTAPRQERVFMFTDIVRSTNLVELIGDEAWGHLVRWHNATLASLISERGGEVVRTMGDGFFVTFEDARKAVECAVAIQRALDDHRREHGFSPRVRIGLHRAKATREGADWSGVQVHAAARIGSLAEGDEILLSRETAEAAGTTFSVSEPRIVSVKGISRPMEVVSVRWR